MAKKEQKKPRINYISQINAFWDCISNNKDLKPTSVVVYLALLHINNMSGWKESFNVPLIVILNMVSLNPKTYYSALDELSNKGYILWGKANNQHQAAIFGIPLLYQISEEQRISTGDTDGRAVTNETEEQRISTGDIHKQLNPEKETLKNKESKNDFTPPVFLDVISFFKNNSDWDDKKCDNVTERFINEYSSKLASPTFDWQNKVKKWVATEWDENEKEAKKNNFPQEGWNRNYFDKITAVDPVKANKYVNHCIKIHGGKLDYTPTGYPKWIFPENYQLPAKPGDNPVQDESNNDWQNDLKISIGSEPKPKIKIPDRQFPGSYM